MQISPAVTPRIAPAQVKPFDLSAIDTPVEALMMPVADMVVAMAASQAQDGKASVKTVVDGQEFTYQTSQTAVDGQMNGQAFSLQATLDEESGSVKFGGQTPGGAVSQEISPVPGGLHVKGTVGSIDFEQELALDPAAGFTGHIADIQGNFAGLPFSQSMVMGEDGQSVKVSGRLGDMEINQTIHEGTNGTVVIEGTVGDYKVYREIVK